MQAFHYSQRVYKHWAKPHHYWACEKVFLFAFMYSCQTVAIPAERLVRSHPHSCYWPHRPAGQVSRHVEVVHGNLEIPWFLSGWGGGRAIIQIPQSLPLHTHRISCSPNMIWGILTPVWWVKPACASFQSWNILFMLSLNQLAPLLLLFLLGYCQ